MTAVTTAVITDMTAVLTPGALRGHTRSASVQAGVRPERASMTQ